MHPLEKFEYCPRCGSHHFVENGARSRKCENCGFEYFMNPSAANVAIIRNSKGEILVTLRKQEPAKGTLDLPGGFTEIGETSEEGVVREVMEETNLKVTAARYLFSLPNVYRYSGIELPTLDMFYECAGEALGAVLEQEVALVLLTELLDQLCAVGGDLLDLLLALVEHLLALGHIREINDVGRCCAGGCESQHCRK